MFKTVIGKTPWWKGSSHLGVLGVDVHGFPAHCPGTDSTCQSYSGGHEARNDRPLSTEPSFFLATKGKGPIVTDDAILAGRSV